MVGPNERLAGLPPRDQEPEPGEVTGPGNYADQGRPDEFPLQGLTRSHQISRKEPATELGGMARPAQLPPETLKNSHPRDNNIVSFPLFGLSQSGAARPSCR